MRSNVPIVLHSQLPVTAETLARLFDSLPEQQKLRAQAMKPSRKSQYVVGRSLVLHYARTRSKESFELRERDELGPTLSIDETPVKISISHTKHHVVVAFSELEIGVDIETIRGGWTANKARLFCCSEEVDHGISIEPIELRNRFFTQCWVRKEAFCKQRQTSVFASEVQNKDLLEDDGVFDFELSVENGLSVLHLGSLYCLGNIDPKFELVCL